MEDNKILLLKVDKGYGVNAISARQIRLELRDQPVGYLLMDLVDGLIFQSLLSGPVDDPQGDALSMIGYRRSLVNVEDVDIFHQRLIHCFNLGDQRLGLDILIDN